jgi:uridine kinase
VIEYALSLLPYESVTIKTPQGVSYEGKRCSVKKMCGVSILRAGETMEAALTEVCKDIRVGKILIQTSPESGEPGNVMQFCPIIRDLKNVLSCALESQPLKSALLKIPLDYILLK